MKRRIFIVLFTFGLLAGGLWNTGNAAGESPLSERNIIQVVSLPVLAKVFPTLIFKEQRFEEFDPGKWGKRLVAYKDDRRYILPGELDSLWNYAVYPPSASYSDRVEAFLRIYFWPEDPELEITSVITTDSLNYTAVITFHQNEIGDSIQTWNISTLNHRVIYATSNDSTRFILFEPSSMIGRDYEYDQDKDKKVLRIGSLLTDRVFPKVEFQIKTTESNPPGVPRVISGKLGHKKYILPRDFNLLDHDVHRSVQPSIEERIVCFFWLADWHHQSNILALEKINNTYKGTVFNYGLYSRYYAESGCLGSPPPVILRLPVLIHAGQILDPYRPLIVHTRGDSAQFTVCTQVIQDSLFSRLFPQVALLKEITYYRMPPRRYITAAILGHKYILPLEFNKLMNSDAQDYLRNNDEVAEAYLRTYLLDEWTDRFDILKHEHINFVDSGIRYNHQVIVRVNPDQINSDSLIFLISSTDKGIVSMIGNYYRGKIQQEMWHNPTFYVRSH